MTKVLISLLLGCVVSFSTPTQTPVPVGQEPRHHVKFQNPYVRVIDAVVPPGDTTLLHTHSADNIPVAISSGKLKIDVQGKPQPIIWTVETGSLSFAPATYSHQIQNIGATPVRFIDAEILASPGGPASAAPPPAPYTLALENGRVRVYRLILEPGQSTGPHTHELAGLDVSVSGGRIVTEMVGKKPQRSTLKPGEFHWHANGWQHSIKNIDTKRLEIVDIEWK